ncbi:hypothetical protein M422DRAFT_264163 [Sphaerobolus stellatus SS14]|uniref:Uncharacterized protein n=1 Tax=Sphaerobolus stellatus (strain SS14) TaxID=990650 RepID=A0A0C9V9C0_SPHS4|nr:hypothetical protein M422DRAFT_264200 [Sphaerobolus stellatus SS14]KIJ33871.1 hypothetical protein M422DRAFT_264163 [Sphaerobolus stellatus SS14]
MDSRLASSSALESRPVNSVLIDDPEVIKPLRRLASLLPMSVVEGQSGDPLAPFAEKLVFLDKGYDLRENMTDKLLDNLIGYGKIPQEIASLIRHGKYDMDGFIQWLKTLILDGNQRGI